MGSERAGPTCRPSLLQYTAGEHGSTRSACSALILLLLTRGLRPDGPVSFRMLMSVVGEHPLGRVRIRGTQQLEELLSLLRLLPAKVETLLPALPIAADSKALVPAVRVDSCAH